MTRAAAAVRTHFELSESVQNSLGWCIKPGGLNQRHLLICPSRGTRLSSFVDALVRFPPAGSKKFPKNRFRASPHGKRVPRRGCANAPLRVVILLIIPIPPKSPGSQSPRPAASRGSTGGMDMHICPGSWKSGLCDGDTHDAIGGLCCDLIHKSPSVGGLFRTFRHAADSLPCRGTQHCMSTEPQHRDACIAVEIGAVRHDRRCGSRCRCSSRPSPIRSSRYARSLRSPGVKRSGSSLQMVPRDGA